MWGIWWLWISAGFALGVLELLAPGYIFLGFALGAVIVGLGLALGVLGGSLPLLLVIFAVASGLSWYGLRRAVGVQRGQVKHWDHDINE